jgi:hypothetical protein
MLEKQNCPEESGQFETHCLIVGKFGKSELFALFPDYDLRILRGLRVIICFVRSMAFFLDVIV